MNINRLLKYGELLAKGAVEAQRIISENYAAKSKIIANIKRCRFTISHFAAERKELVELINKDKEIFERVKRWVESKESNTALKMLEEGMKIEIPVNLGKELSKIIDFNKRDHKILMKFEKLLDEQEELLKDMYRTQSSKFAKMFEKSLKKQHKYFEELNYYGTQSSRSFNAFFTKAKRAMYLIGQATVALGTINMWGFQITGDERDLQAFTANVLILISGCLFYKLLKVCETSPQFTKQIRTYLSKWEAY